MLMSYFNNFHFRKLLLLFSFALIEHVSFAQHQHMGNMNMQKDTMKMETGTMKLDMGAMKMNSSLSLNLPMNLDGSGTSWQPDESPMMMYMKMQRNTSLIVHGNIFIRYISQEATNKSKAEKKFDAPNWFMLMLSQKLNEKDLVSFI